MWKMVQQQERVQIAQTHKKKTNDDKEVDILEIDLDTIELELI